MARSIPYKDFLYKALKNSERAFGYLNEVLSHYKASDKESHKCLALCLGNIVQAHCGVKKLGQKTGLDQDHLERILFEAETPSLETLTKIINGVFDFKVTIQVRKKAEALDAVECEDECELEDIAILKHA